MIDYISSKCAQREHEERVRSLTPVTDYDKWLTREAGHWQAPPLGAALSTLVKSLVSFAIQRKQQPEPAASAPLPVPETRRVTG